MQRFLRTGIKKPDSVCKKCAAGEGQERSFPAVFAYDRNILQERQRRAS